MGTIVNVRMSPEMLEQTTRIARDRGYLSVQEYMREAVRQDAERYRLLKEELDKITASAKRVTPRRLTAEDYAQMARTAHTRKLTPAERLAQRSTRELLKLQGVAKGKKIKRLTHDERDELAREYMDEILAQEAAGTRPKDALAEVKAILAPKKRKR
jgi:Arc/MetJ-type ribon-helix-helix transcriptional regulator